MDRTKNILVTGGAGYIGSHTCKALQRKGYMPVTYDNLIYGSRSAVKWGPFEFADILNSEELDRVFQKYNPVAVIHFAAFAYVGESVVDPGKYYVNNVSGTLNILEAMRRNHCEYIIFSSTCATYGVPEFLPITEEQNQKPVNPYGRSKLMIEQILDDYARAYGIKHIILRYFNAAGADSSGDVGENHDPETHLIPILLDVAKGKRQHIEIYGTDYDTPDGTAIRDYVHVSDLATAHLKSLEVLQETEESDCFNLGTGKGISVGEVINSVKRVCKTDIPLIYGSRRAGDPPILVADAVKAQKRLDWFPEHSDMETIIRTAWNWHSGKFDP